MGNKLDELAETFEEAMDQKDQTIEWLQNQYERDMNEMVEKLKQSEEEKLDILRNRKTQESGSMPKITDLQKVGESMLADVRSLAEANESAQKKRELLKGLIEEEDEETLKDLSLDELQKLETKDIRKETENKLKEKGKKFEETYQKLLEDTKPDFSPSQSELERRRHAQAAVQERLRGIQDPEKLTEAFEDMVKSEPKPKQQEAYDIVYNRLKNQGDPAAENRIEKLRRQHVLTKSEREQLKKHEKFKGAKDFVDMWTSNLRSKMERIHKDQMTFEDANEYLEGSAEPVLDRVMREMKDDSKSTGAGWEG